MRLLNRWKYINGNGFLGLFGKMLKKKLKELEIDLEYLEKIEESL